MGLKNEMVPGTSPVVLKPTSTTITTSMATPILHLFKRKNKGIKKNGMWAWRDGPVCKGTLMWLTARTLFADHPASIPSTHDRQLTTICDQTCHLLLSS